MGTAAAVLALVPLLCWAVVHASHVVYPELQSLEAKEVATELRTGYHFQPPKNWINGEYCFLDPSTPLHVCGSSSSSTGHCSFLVAFVCMALTYFP